MATFDSGQTALLHGALSPPDPRSRQPTLVAKPVVGFKLCHVEEMTEHMESVPLRDL